MDLRPAFTLGNAPRTDTRQRTPFKTQTDIAFQKTEPVGGSKEIMVRFEMINIFNNTQFNGPNMTFGSSSFGRISSNRGFPRMLQFMVRFAFLGNGTNVLGRPSGPPLFL